MNMNKDTRYSYKKTITEESPFSAWNDKPVIIIFWAGAECVCGKMIR